MGTELSKSKISLMILEHPVSIVEAGCFSVQSSEQILPSKIPYSILKPHW